MKIVVQNCLNFLYLKSVNEWTADPSEAAGFPSSDKAIVFCTENRLPAVQIVLQFDPKGYDIAVPISDECAQATDPQKALRK